MAGDLLEQLDSSHMTDHQLPARRSAAPEVRFSDLNLDERKLIIQTILNSYRGRWERELEGYEGQPLDADAYQARVEEYAIQLIFMLGAAIEELKPPRLVPKRRSSSGPITEEKLKSNLKAGLGYFRVTEMTDAGGAGPPCPVCGKRRKTVWWESGGGLTARQRFVLQEYYGPPAKTKEEVAQQFDRRFAFLRSGDARITKQGVSKIIDQAITRLAMGFPYKPLRRLAKVAFGGRPGPPLELPRANLEEVKSGPEARRSLSENRGFEFVTLRRKARKG